MREINCIAIRDDILKKANDILDGYNDEVKLVVIQVEGDEASDRYIRSKKRACDQMGFEFKHIKLPCNTLYWDIRNAILIANEDESVAGIMLQLPLPQRLSCFEQDFIDMIDPRKDVDGLTTTNVGRLWNNDEGLRPCTAQGISSLINEYYFDLFYKYCKDVCIVGRSKLIGKPLVQILQNEYDATVTLCHSKTKDIKKHTLNADIVILATGQGKMFDKSYFKNDALVIDAGIDFDKNGKMCGDADSKTFKHTNIAFTPVPKGVGVITVAQLMLNLAYAYKGKFVY